MDKDEFKASVANLEGFLGSCDELVEWEFVKTPLKGSSECVERKTKMR